MVCFQREMYPIHLSNCICYVPEGKKLFPLRLFAVLRVIIT